MPEWLPYASVVLGALWLGGLHVMTRGHAKTLEEVRGELGGIRTSLGLMQANIAVLLDRSDSP